MSGTEKRRHPLQEATADVVVPGSWCDFNGHLNIVHYLEVFDGAIGEMFDRIGWSERMDPQVTESVFVAEIHLTYQHEVHEADRVLVHSQVLAVDAKRVQIFHTMTGAGSQQTAATAEMILLSIDRAKRKVAPFSLRIRNALESLLREDVVMPVEAGRGISIDSRGFSRASGEGDS